MTLLKYCLKNHAYAAAAAASAAVVKVDENMLPQDCQYDSR